MTREQAVPGDATEKQSKVRQDRIPGRHTSSDLPAVFLQTLIWSSIFTSFFPPPSSGWLVQTCCLQHFPPAGEQSEDRICQASPKGYSLASQRPLSPKPYSRKSDLWSKSLPRSLAQGGSPLILELSRARLGDNCFFSFKLKKKKKSKKGKEKEVGWLCF